MSDVAASLPPLTVGQARDAIAQLGPPAKDDGRAHCPVCNAGLRNPACQWTLTISQNGNGAHLECTTGCPPAAIGAVLRIVPGLPSKRSDDPLLQLRTLLGNLPVERVVKRGAGDSYELHLPEGRIVELGTAEQVFNRRHFEAAVLGQASHVLPAVKAPEHREVVALVEAAAEHHDGLSGAEELEGWLADFARSSALNREYDLEDQADRWELASSTPSAFRATGGRLCIRLDALATYINRVHHQRITAREVSTRLGRLGFTKPDHGGQIAARRDGEVRKVRVWIGPTGSGGPT